MNDNKKIIWLASYPKSGNTWFRAFLTAFLNPAREAIDINNLYDTTIASSRILFDELAGISSGDLTFDEIDRLRPMIYRKNAEESKEIIYHKTHDAWLILPDGTPMFPQDVTKGVIYFIRNPLDVAVSFSHHLNTTVEKTIEIMNNPEYAFCFKQGRLHNQLRQKLDSWSGHVKSWVYDSGLPLLVLRYEDMKTQPIETFTKAVDFIGLKPDILLIEKALQMSSFEELRRQEHFNGFHEKNSNTSDFFRKGMVNDWKNVLSKDQIKRIRQTHSTLMKSFGYYE